jgi:uncharacterized protein YjbI with pentapeptide repeats
MLFGEFVARYRRGERSFGELNVTGGVLADLTISDCAFAFCKFDGADLTNVTFARCSFNVATFNRARFYPTVHFASCTFDHVNFAHTRMTKARFDICTFKLTDFTDSWVHDTTFYKSVFDYTGYDNLRISTDNSTSAAVPVASLASRVNFDGSELDRVNFSKCELYGLKFRNSKFKNSRLSDCKLMSLQLVNASLVSTEVIRSDVIATSLAQSSIRMTRFIESTFADVSFRGAILELVSFFGCFMECAQIAQAVFRASDLGPFCDSVSTLRMGDPPPLIDWRSVCRSIRNPSLHRFLLASGMPDIMSQYLVVSARAVDPEMLFKLMRSTFISYGAPDREFAKELRDQLERHGVTTYFFDSDAIPGERLHRLMYDGINKYDRVILICSEAALARPGVRSEIEETFARESRDGGASYLIPVARDSFVFQDKDPISCRIRDRVVADFRSAPIGSNGFSDAIQRLLMALRKDATGNDPNGA